MLRITELLKKYQLSDIKAVDDNGDTILHLVVKDEDFTAPNRVEMLKMLLNNGLDLHSKNQLGETVLHVAISNRARDVIDFLLTRKVDLDNSAALYLIENEYNKLLGLKKQSSIPEDEIQKKESDSASFLEWMMAKGLNIDSQNRYGKSALFLSIDYDLLHLLPVLLKYTKNIDYVECTSRRTLLHVVLGNKAKTRWSTSYSRRYATSDVKVLLDRGVSPQSVDSTLNTALHLAITDCTDINVVQKLIDHTTNFNNKNDAGETPLLIALRKWLKCEKPNNDDYRKILETLIMKGAHVDESNQLGRGPLHIFAEETSSCECLDEEEIELFNMLISIGCNVNARDSNGRTPLHLAASSKNKAVVQKLIESGAHVNCRDDDRATPLHFIALCKRNYREIAEMLIEHGANVNARDCEGFTPVHKVAGNEESGFDNTDRLKILLQQGADFGAPSGQEYSVLDVGVIKFHNCYLLDPQGVAEDCRKKLSLHEVWESSFFNYRYLLCGEIEFLLMHWIKLYAAKFECRIHCKKFRTEKIDDEIDLQYYEDSAKVYRDCMKEIEILKDTFIDKNRTSIYDFLHMNLNSRRLHVNNKKLQKLVRSTKQLEKQFPQYAILILSSYNEMLKRKSLMEPAKIAWIKLNKTHLGDLCIEHIFSFLGNVELYDLIEASGIDYFR